MTIIKNIGRYCPTDKQGFILNDASVAKIQPEHMTLIEDVVEDYRLHMGDHIHSLYIRGSIPRGLGIYGVSDLDTLAVTHVAPGSLDLRWVEEAERIRNHQYQGVNGIEFSFYSLKDLLNKTIAFVYTAMI
ncbi:hypothetical protein [Halalkalibacterium halodurans]|uniref:hypothetical protein n=1 Tax=Halalkalibacterium halodurans TaxID=86665 RepID=UPI001FB932F8|nr:hypothetical protein [Halalkalibacterium halodurans]MDY7224164.1 hypothetical protein [Halalkalibacterium halodurans]MDY7243449.1 hypothetical protein [Halalkalibacterium halodurans]